MVCGGITSSVVPLVRGKQRAMLGLRVNLRQNPNAVSALSLIVLARTVKSQDTTGESATP